MRNPVKKPNESFVLAKALRNSAAYLGLEQQEIASMLKVTPGALSKSLNSGIDPGKLQGRYALLIFRVYRSLYPLLGGNKEHMAKWIRGKLKPFNKTPFEMMNSEVDIVFLNEYLDSMRAKS